ncbi:Succinyl-diaminopimelate desuccinylase [Candidatus Johnevansia muelleri]|uniref:Succinyl-diaminopimelate desuccinylase n=1 Tax=Candidatus Johnevansia muelleri TaxID=1495769 RepID=A0A078KDP0_9GAMM|nr:Succinyl-diaminopimelate desuccinylase [Candidatus Evansia muelleri]
MVFLSKLYKNKIIKIQNNKYDNTLNLAMDLISRRSITPKDAGCQYIISKRLSNLGFNIETIKINNVTNLWATRGIGKTLAFLGHTDVVPSGPEYIWKTPPFTPTLYERYIYGRGAADMKCSLAAMVTAIERFINNNPSHKGRIAILLTSDEEGKAIYGTKAVIDKLYQRNEKIEYCIVGEPSCVYKFGDMIKNGRRGSLNSKIIIYGIQGHIAYEKSLINPIHIAIPVILALITEKWNCGNKFFTATSFQISNFNAGIGAENVVPNKAIIVCNFRFSNDIKISQIRTRVKLIFANHGLFENVDYHIDWSLSGEPFITNEGELIDAVITGVKIICGMSPIISTSGGTSDGRFLSKLGSQVIELGLVGKTIHKINECVLVSDLYLLTTTYQTIIEYLL